MGPQLTGGAILVTLHR